MKKSMFMVGLAALALTSCSQDEVLDVQKDAITFATVADNASRANITTTDNITSFKVWGVVNQGTSWITYINGEAYTRDEPEPSSDVDKQWKNQDSGYYWPVGTMDFYAVSPSTVTEASLGTPVAYETNTAKISGYKIADDATTQTDLLYALTVKQSKKAEAVPLNFKHALSQVTFKVAVDATFPQSVDIVVNSIKVVNIANKGDFAFPKVDGEAGEWKITTDSENKTYTVSPNVTLNYEKGTLAETAETTSMLLLPQEENVASTAPTWTTGTHFILNVTMTDKTSGAKLVEGDTYVPYAVNMEAGYKYVYTFKYTGNENGGGVDKDGNDQLVKILFTCDVAAFTDATDATIELKK